MAFRSSNSASASTSVNTITVSAPTGTATGDVMVGSASTDQASETVTLPTGFTALPSSTQSSTLDGATMACATKAETGTPPASYVFSFGAFTSVAAVVAAYTGRDTTTPVHKSAGTASSTGGTSPRSMAITSVTTTLAGCDFVYLGSADWNGTAATGYAPPTNYTERADVISGGFASITLDDWENQAATSGGTVTGTASASSGSAGFMAFWIALAPSGGVAATSLPLLRSRSRLAALLQF